MNLLRLTGTSITLVQEDGAPLARWTWTEKQEAIDTLRECGFGDAADFLNEFAEKFPALTTEQLELAA